MENKWEIVFDYLIYLIKENIVKQGEVLPSQNMLKTKFKFSEQPIRVAFQKLVELKLVESQKGRGYVVGKKTTTNGLFSFKELFPNSNSEYYDFKNIVVNKELEQRTGFILGTEVIWYKTKRFNDNTLILFQESWLPKNSFKNLDIKLFQQKGLFWYIENKTEFKVSHSAKKIYFLEDTEIMDEVKNETNKNLYKSGLIVDQGSLFDIYNNLIEYRESFYSPKNFDWEFIEWRK